MTRAPFEPTALSRRDASGQIARQLREAIGRGVWAPDEQLPTEHELAETYDVARSTAREALKLLSATGLVRSARGAQGGTYVAVPDADSVAGQLSDAMRLWFRAGDVTVHHVDEARHLLETVVVRLAARNRDADDVAAIRRAVDAAHDPGIGIDEWLDWDLAFHAAISRAAKNPILELAMMSVHLIRPETNSVFVHLLDRQRVLAQHAAIADAIELGDGGAAESAFERHVGYLDEVRRRALTALGATDIELARLPLAAPPTAGAAHADTEHTGAAQADAAQADAESAERAVGPTAVGADSGGGRMLP